MLRCMNFIALIGIVENFKNVNNTVDCNLKVEKSGENQDQWYDLIQVKIDGDTFKKELKELKEGDIIGVKGRIINNNNNHEVVCERLQIF